MKAQEMKGKIVSPQRISYFLIAPHRWAAAARSHQMAGPQLGSSALMKLRHYKVYLSSAISSCFLHWSLSLCSGHKGLCSLFLACFRLSSYHEHDLPEVRNDERGKGQESSGPFERCLTGNWDMGKKHKFYRDKNLGHAEKLPMGNSQWGQQGRQELSSLLLEECGKKKKDSKE